MKCFVLFGTVEGHTRHIADAIGKSIVESEHEAVLFDLSKGISGHTLKDCDACIIAAPVHQQRHPDEVINFTKANNGQLNRMSSALVSVSLSAAFPDGQAEAQSVPENSAQQVAGKLIDAGIREILNFAPVTLNVPEDTHVRYADLALELENLSYHLNSRI